MTTAAELTQPDVARLMGLLTSSTVKALIRSIDSEVTAGRISWAPYRGKADTFGKSLAQQVRNGRSLSLRQINAAKGRLLQRNWEQVKHVLSRGLVTVPGVTLESATDAARQAPTYSQRRGAGVAPATSPTRASRRRRTPVAAPVVPVAVPQPRVCGKKLAYTYDGQKCTRPKGHPGGCIGERPNAPQAPTNDVDSVLAGLGRSSTPNLPAPRPEADGDVDPSVDRFLRVVEAAWDDVPAATYVEPEFDPSIERFKLLDLD